MCFVFPVEVKLGKSISDRESKVSDVKKLALSYSMDKYRISNSLFTLKICNLELHMVIL